MDKILIVLAMMLAFTTSAWAEDVAIDMLNKRADGEKMAYSVDIARIDVGDTVTWLPAKKGHNVEFRAGPDGVKLPRKSKMNKEFSMTFDTPGIYYYWCTPHKAMGMIGLVVVGDDTSNKDAIAKTKTSGKSKKKLKKLLTQL